MRVITDNLIRRRLESGEIAFAVATHLREPAIVEMIGLGGFDAVFIDMENSSLDLRDVEDLIRAADVVGVSSNVRVPDLNAVVIRRVLDLGAHAVTIPHVRSADEAYNAVRAARFPPIGERGASPSSRGAGYGSADWTDYSRRATDTIVVMATIEDEEGLRNLEGIAAVDGVDVVAVGPSDLAQTIGVVQPEDPRLRGAVEAVAAKVARAGKALGFPSNHRMLQMSHHDRRSWGVRYSNVGPPLEKVVLNHLKETRASLRRG